MSLPKFLIYIGIFSFFLSCNQSVEQSGTTNTQAIIYPSEFTKSLDAHGGIDLWKQQNTLQFSFIKNNKLESHNIDLSSRKSFISFPDWKLGFDGNEVWISPNKEAFGKGSPRFYHNLYFYFFAMPFVLADPGISYEVMPQDSLNGQLFIPIKMNFKIGVGDAWDDEYIAYINPETGLLGALLYTVTYYSGEKSLRYNAIIYDNWTTVNGLKVPASIKGYSFENGNISDKRYELQFENILISTDKLDPAIFEMPENSEIDSLLKH